MNEKIKVIEQQANDYTVNLITNKSLGVGQYHQTFSNKFAELIVEECIRAIENTGGNTQDYYKDAIREHLEIPAKSILDYYKYE